MITGRKTQFPGLYLPVYTRGIGTSLGVTGCIREYAGIPEYVLYTSRKRLQNGTSLGIYGRIQSRKQGFSSSVRLVNAARHKMADFLFDYGFCPM